MLIHSVFWVSDDLMDRSEATYGREERRESEQKKNRQVLQLL